MRCYARPMSAVAALLIVGLLALGHSTGHALADAGLITAVIIIVSACLLVSGLIYISAAAIRRRRAAAGACHTCSHPCREQPDLSAPRWPHRPLTRGEIPVIVISRDSDGQRSH
jgi:hypothetical protein